MVDDSPGSSAQSPWVPPRPPANTVVWGAHEPARRSPAALAGPGDQGPESRPDDDVPTFRGRNRRIASADTRRRGWIARSWGRFGAGRRILLSYLALAVVVVAVTGIGTTLQPTYGASSPWQGIQVDDLRSAPSTDAWAVDLAATLSPGSPPECLRFTAVDIGQDLAAVRAEAPWSYGFSSDSVCSVVPEGFRSRIALLDTATGDLRWVHDVSADLTTGGAVSVASMSAVDGGTRLLLRAEASSETVIESLAISTGDVVGTTGPLRWAPDGRFTAAGDVVATGIFNPDDLDYEYELRDVDDLSRVVWRGTANETATMIALSDRLLLGERGTLQIPLATGIATPWGGAVDTSLGYAEHDDVVFAQHTSGSGVTTTAARGFSAMDRTGHVLWSSTLDLRGRYSVTRSCLAVTNRAGDRMSCLDYRTGAVLWSDDIGSFSSASSVPGQRSSDVYAVATTDRTRITALDGRSGRPRFTAEVPPGSVVVAAGQTVVYALAYGFSGSRSSVVALDASSGKRLWTHSSQVQLSLWGGHLIDVGMDGLARQLSS